MKRLLILISVLCLLATFGFAEESDVHIHNLWDLNIVSMDVKQVHDYLETEKGILSKIVWNYDDAGHNSLNSMDDQDLTLLGYPFSLHFVEYKRGKSLSLNFRTVGPDQDAFNIVNALIEKYGAPTHVYYDLYSRSDYEWEHNIGTPMWHKRCLLESIEGFNILDTLLNWEHYEENKYSWGEIQLTIHINNIEIQIEEHDYGKCSVYITFDSYVPDMEIEEVDESRNISNYTDTGF